MTTLTVFHGTDDADFDSFDIEMFGENYGTCGQPAIYTATSEEDAEFYGREIKTLTVDVSNYKTINMMEYLTEVYDLFDSYQETEFSEWVDSMNHTELLEVLDFDSTIGNDAISVKQEGFRGLIADFSGTNCGDVVLSFSANDLIVK